MICLYKERDIFKNGFTNVLNFAFTNVVYLVRKLNVSSKSARFTDKAPVDNACYEVVAYYPEGDYSATSEQMCIGSLTSVHNYVADGVRVEISRATGTLTVSGDYDSASLIGVNGVCVAKSVGHSFSANGLSAGIYMLKIEKDGRQSVRKIMIVK